MSLDPELRPQFDMCPFCTVNFTLIFDVDDKESIMEEETFKSAGISDVRQEVIDRSEQVQFWNGISKKEIAALREWYAEDFDAFGYDVKQYFDKIGLKKT